MSLAGRSPRQGGGPAAFDEALPSEPVHERDLHAGTRSVRWGDLLPLPLEPREQAPAVPSTRSSQRRQLRGVRDTDEMNETVRALNYLSGFEDEAAWPRVPTCVAQRSALQQICKACAGRSWPKHSGIDARAALRKLLRQAPAAYSDEPAGALSSFQAGRVSLPSDHGGCDLLDVLDEDERHAVAHFYAILLRSPVEMADALDSADDIGLYTDPAFKCPRVYAQFIRELIDCKLASLSTRVKGQGESRRLFRC